MTRGGSRWYAPNQQAVRADGSGPAEEGDGGTPHATHPDRPPPEPTTTSVEASEQDLDAMTKDELIAYAEQRGVDVDVSMTKTQIREAIGA